jgi:hypothetical protein
VSTSICVETQLFPSSWRVDECVCSFIRGGLCIDSSSTRGPGLPSDYLDWHRLTVSYDSWLYFSVLVTWAGLAVWGTLVLARTVLVEPSSERAWRNLRVLVACMLLLLNTFFIIGPGILMSFSGLIRLTDEVFPGDPQSQANFQELVGGTFTAFSISYVAHVFLVMVDGMPTGVYVACGLILLYCPNRVADLIRVRVALACVVVFMPVSSILPIILEYHMLVREFRGCMTEIHSS